MLTNAPDAVGLCQPEAGGRSLRTLLVEDCEDDAQLILRELRKDGWRTDWRRVYSRSALEEALGQGPWDLVICDHVMPSFSSFEALAVVRGRSLDLPFIIVSGAAPEEVVSTAMRNGAHDFISKGHLIRLAPAVRRELQEAALRRERKGMASRLAACEARQALLAEAVDQEADPIAVTGPDGTVTYANHAFEAFTDLEPERIAGRRLEDLLGHPDLAEALTRAADGQHWTCRVGVPGHGLEARAVDLTCSPVRDPGGTVRSLVVLMRDQTKEVQLERELHQAQKMDALGLMAAGVAHDFNNMLTAILASAELLQCRLPADSPLQKRVETILRTGHDAAGLTQRVLSFSHKDREERIPLDFTTVVRDVLGTLRETLPANVELVDRITSGVWVESAPGQLQQMVLNLAINAVQAMQPAGGSLLVALTEDSGGPEQAGRPRRATLVVQDSGCGMTPEVRERIFEPFFTTKPAGQGTGLGLAMVHAAVKQSGGTIRVDSAPGQGTTFRIELPSATGQATAARETPAKPAQPFLALGTARRARILLAEDNRVQCSLLPSWLRRAGYQVQVASDGLDAWERFTHGSPGQRFEVLLTDLAMPRMDGLELIQLVRKADPAIAIGLLGSDADPGAVAAALHLGVDELLARPDGCETAESWVSALLAKRVARLDQQRSRETAQAVRQAQKAMAAAPEQGVPLFTLYEPLTDAGGDLFRCFRGDDGTVLFVVADVAGHSVLSSYSVASFLGMLSSRVGECLEQAAGGGDAGECLQGLAGQLNQGIQTSPFAEVPVCALLGLWDPASGRVHLVNAGIPHGLHYQYQSRRCRPVPLNGTPLGVFPEPDLEGAEFRLEPGDRLLFGTDGFFEARGADRTRFQDLAQDRWQALAGSPLDWALSAICEQVRIHCGGAFEDDLLVMGFEQPAPVAEAGTCLLRMPSTTRAVDLACERFRAWLKACDGPWRPGRERCFDLVLAVREALTNAVLHGNRGRAEAAVQLRWQLRADPGELAVTVTDEGPGFDLAVQEPPSDPLADRGRGLAFIRSCARTLQADGSTVTMTFGLKEETHVQP
jgi:PAS domain S-box-containing protein